MFVETLTRALASSGGAEAIEPSVVTPRVHKNDAAREVRHGVKVQRFMYPSGGRRLKEVARPSMAALAAYVASGTAALLKETHLRAAHVVLCHWALPCGPIAATASIVLRVPFLVIAHGSDISRHARAGPMAWAARWALSKARCVAAVSADLRRKIEHLGLVPSGTGASVRVVPMGVDSSLFLPSLSWLRDRLDARARLGIKRDAALLLFVGDLAPEKGVLDLLEALGLLRLRGFEVETALAGSGMLKPLLEKQASESRLRVLGRVSQADLVTWHRAADLLVLPSHSEGAPVAVMEALASGLPVVATRVGGLSELVLDGVTGWLVPSRDPASLSREIERLLGDPGLLAGARRTLAESPCDFGVERRAREYRALLEEVVHGA